MRIFCFVLILMLTFSSVVFAQKKHVRTFNVGFIYVSPVSFEGWSYSHEKARKNLEQELGIKTRYVENVFSNSDAESILKTMSLSGKNIIFGTSYSYNDGMKKVAKQFPDVNFFNAGGFAYSKNMSSYMGRMYQARYLSGIVAGAMTKSKKIGYVAAFPIGEVIRGINAFTLGAQSINPQVKVYVDWTNSWYEPDMERKIAKSLIDLGCDVLAQHQDTGTVQEMAEESKIYSIGYHTDMSIKAPNAHLTAAVWNWEPVYNLIIEQIRNNEWVHGSYWYGLSTGVIGLSPYNDVVPQDIRDKVEQAKDEIIKGNLNIFEGPIKNQQGKIQVAIGVKLNDYDLINMSWFVDGVIGKIN